MAPLYNSKCRADWQGWPEGRKKSFSRLGGGKDDHHYGQYFQQMIAAQYYLVNL